MSMKSLKILSVTIVCFCLAGSANALTTTLREGPGYEMGAVNVRTDSGANQDGYGIHVGNSYNGHHYRGLLEYDLAPIGAGRQIDSITLTVTSNRGNGGTLLGLHSYAYDFDETTAKRYSVAPGDTSTVGTLGSLLTEVQYSSSVWGASFTFASTDAFVAAANEAMANDEPLRMIIAALTTGTIASLYGDDNTPSNAGYETWRPTLTIESSEAPVPEPATMAALTAGLAGLGGYIRKRRNA